METTNEKRAENAYRTLLNAGFNVSPQEMDASIIDCMTDLLHLAPEYGLEPDYVLRTAKMHYDSEAAEEAQS